MSQENVELVRNALAAWVEVDEGLVEVDRLGDFFAADAVWDTGFEGETHGRDGFLEWRAAWLESYDDWSYRPEKILDAGANLVVVTFHQRGKLRDSQSWVEMHYGIVYTVEEGLITRSQVYATAEDALQAAGLSE